MILDCIRLRYLSRIPAAGNRTFHHATGAGGGHVGAVHQRRAAARNSTADRNSRAGSSSLREDTAVGSEQYRPIRQLRRPLLPVGCTSLFLEFAFGMQPRAPMRSRLGRFWYDSRHRFRQSSREVVSVRPFDLDVGPLPHTGRFVRIVPGWPARHFHAGRGRQIGMVLSQFWAPVQPSFA